MLLSLLLLARLVLALLFPVLSLLAAGPVDPVPAVRRWNLTAGGRRLLVAGFDPGLAGLFCLGLSFLGPGPAARKILLAALLVFQQGRDWPRHLPSLVAALRPDYRLRLHLQDRQILLGSYRGCNGRWLFRRLNNHRWPDRSCQLYRLRCHAIGCR